MGNSKSTRAAGGEEKALAKIFSRQTALRSDMFALSPVGHHGIPSNARTMAYCGLQGILAVGTASGHVKLYGKDYLEVMIEVPKSKSNLTIGVVKMQFTATQRLMVTYTDSSIRLYDLAMNGKLHVEIPEVWTTSMICCLGVISFFKFPYFFVATDDGDIHVFHEESGKKSTYVISPKDIGITSSEENRHMQFVTTMAANPRDANQILIAYETSSSVFLWDFAKRKVIREFSLVLSRPRSDAINSVQSLSWHVTGKRFVAGYKHGGLGIFRVDKSNGIYHYFASDDDGDAVAPITQLHWLCAPPVSRQSSLPGAILFTGGRSDAEKNKLTIIYPPSNLSEEDALVELAKSEHLAWPISTIMSANQAEISTFVVADAQVDQCIKIAPFSVMMLSGNPLDGCQPLVSVQCLPAFVRFREGNKEVVEWDFGHLPDPCVIPPLLQSSPLRTFTVVNLRHSDGALQDDLYSTWDQERIDPIFRLLAGGEFEWPLNGGVVTEPLLKGFLPSGAIKDEMKTIFQNGTLLLTGHENGHVLFWELLPPAERSSRGTISLLHSIDAPLQMEPIPECKEITCIAFCHEARVLVVGFRGGEVAVFEFGQWKQRRPSSLVESHFSPEVLEKDLEEKQAPTLEHSSSSGGKEVIGFRTLFTVHTHTSEITTICLSTAYGYVAVADANGVVSLLHLPTQSSKLLIFDVSSEEPLSVDSLLMSELVQVTDVPTNLPGTTGGAVTSGGKTPPRSQMQRRLSRGGSSSSGDCALVMQHRAVIPVLFVGRGNGKLEMYHVQAATKMGESLVDPKKTTSLSSIMMIDADGKQIEIPGRVWVEQGDLGGDVPLSTDDIQPDLDELPTDAPVRHVRSPSTELEQTKQLVLEAISERASDSSSGSDVVVVQDEDAESTSPSWTQSNTIEVVIPPGSLGLNLFTEIEQHAVVKGFVVESETGAMLEAKGIHAGHAITAINGLDVTRYDRQIVCAVLEKLRDCEKKITFADGFGLSPSSNTKDIGEFNDLLNDGSNHTDVERPRFLLCTCGRNIHLIQAVLPKASEMASGPKELVAQPLASVELKSPVLVTSVIRVPVDERIEYCLAVVDQSNQLYIMSLLNLQVIGQTECASLGNALDGILSDITYGGELVTVNSFGELERFSFFGERTATENALLERKCIKTKLHQFERQYPFEKEQHPSPKKKSIADASKMLKKFVAGMKDAADLDKVFHFSTEEQERQKLMGDRRKSATTQDEQEPPSAMSTVNSGIGGTKDALMQATQHLHERGDKLRDLAVKTEQMKTTSEDFYKSMKAFNEKNANKKWYEF